VIAYANKLIERSETVCYIVEMTGDQIRKLREGLGLSKRQFAKILKVSNMMIVRAERGTPSRALSLYIEKALEEGLFKPSDRKSKPSDRS
jgi:DNA-binding transcriptional regulator YiaG